MSRNERNFKGRKLEEQKQLLEKARCDFCDKDNPGVAEPKEYEENGTIYLEGECSLCGLRVVSKIG